MAKQRSMPVAAVRQHTPAAQRREGFPLPVKVDSSAPSANGDISFGVDASSAPVPQRRYVADVCDVRVRDNDVGLIFAQRNLIDDGIDSSLTVRMAPTAIRQFLNSLSTLTPMDAIVEELGVAPLPLHEFKSNPAQMVSVVSNLIAVAVSGYETCLDFYHASAFSMRETLNSNILDVEPIVRVDMATALFASMLGRIRSLASELPYRKGEPK